MGDVIDLGDSPVWCKVFLWSQHELKYNSLNNPDTRSHFQMLMGDSPADFHLLEVCCGFFWPWPLHTVAQVKKWKVIEIIE